MTSPPRPLTGQPLKNLRHERFSVGVVSGLNGTQAWLAVSPDTKPAAAAVTANRLLSDAKVLARIAELRAPAVAAVQERADEAVASEEWLVEQAVEIVQRSLAPQPVYEGRGKERRLVEGVWTYDGRTAVAALALLARRQPGFSEKHEITGDLRVRLEALTAVAHMSPDEMKALAARARA